jgi:hypothetical protein
VEDADPAVGELAQGLVVGIVAKSGRERSNLRVRVLLKSSRGGGGVKHNSTRAGQGPGGWACSRTACPRSRGGGSRPAAWPGGIEAIEV